MNPFFHAVAFLTRLPVPRLSDSKEDWVRSVPYYPLVGLLIGALLWLAAISFSFLLTPPVAAVLTLAVWIFVTGGLHLDGWMDLADGLGSHRPREDMLRIMKDSRVGAMGVIAAILLILLKAVLLYEIIQKGLSFHLVLVPVLARLMLVFAIWHWPYVSVQGIGTGMREGLTRWKIGIGFIFVASLALLLEGVPGLLSLVVVLLMGWMFTVGVCKKLGGLTGDAYGALVEWTEAVGLLLLFLFWRWLG
ncbi:adenosylcobinamide-GDP ribazoletransferase [Ammoniphilus sp. 3BR4]|uniref:adenosylcobinamide-GDP ribazoletransferase n=1 Tax=Ammoniphilus sp. 3BR4 TaxID=3158265 RepID=UPI003467B64F